MNFQKDYLQSHREKGRTYDNLSKEEIYEVAEEQKRSGGADIKFLSVKMSEYLSEKFPVPDKTRS